MIDSYRQQDFVNQSASEIVSAIAQYHNLQAVVTPTMVTLDVTTAMDIQNYR